MLPKVTFPPDPEKEVAHSRDLQHKGAGVRIKYYKLKPIERLCSDEDDGHGHVCSQYRQADNDEKLYMDKIKQGTKKLRSKMKKNNRRSRKNQRAQAIEAQALYNAMLQEESQNKENQYANLLTSQRMLNKLEQQVQQQKELVRARGEELKDNAETKMREEAKFDSQ